MDGANLVGGAARRPATLTRGAHRQIPDPVKEGKQGRIIDSAFSVRYPA
jgi:hypothetical protein